MKKTNRLLVVLKCAGVIAGVMAVGGCRSDAPADAAGTAEGAVVKQPLTRFNDVNFIAIHDAAPGANASGAQR